MGEGGEGRCRREGEWWCRKGRGEEEGTVLNVLGYVWLHSSDLNSRVQSLVLLR